MNLRHALSLTILMVCLCTSASEGALPASVIGSSKLSQVGAGVYRKWGFSIYSATLWAPESKWNSSKPYALQLQYNRDLSKETLISSMMDGLREQGAADEATLLSWKKIVEDTLPAVNKNDDIVAIASPGKDAHIYLNGKPIASIGDRAFIKAFFAIWLGDKADPGLRSSLLGPGESGLGANN